MLMAWARLHAACVHHILAMYTPLCTPNNCAPQCAPQTNSSPCLLDSMLMHYLAMEAAMEAAMAPPRHATPAHGPACCCARACILLRTGPRAVALARAGPHAWACMARSPGLRAARLYELGAVLPDCHMRMPGACFNSPSGPQDRPGTTTWLVLSCAREQLSYVVCATHGSSPSNGPGPAGSHGASLVVLAARTGVALRAARALGSGATGLAGCG